MMAYKTIKNCKIFPLTSTILLNHCYFNSFNTSFNIFISQILEMKTAYTEPANFPELTGNFNYNELDGSPTHQVTVNK